MLDKIIKYSLNNRLIILVSGLLVLLAGSYITSRIEIDIFPDLNAPTVVVMTEAHGMASEEVEKLVTFPIETAINGATGIRRVRSSSSMGFSIVWAEFNWGVDIYNARQIVSEKLQTINDVLPVGIGNPMLAPQSSLLGEIMIFSISSDSIDPLHLRTLAEWEIRPQLLAVGGVAQITIIGGEYKEYQILADPYKMKNYDVTMNELLEASQSTNENASGGFINEFGNEYIIRGIARTTDIEEIGNTVIKMREGAPVLLKHVCAIKIGAAPKIGDGSYRGESAVVITVNKQPNVNTIDLTKELNETIVEIQEKLPDYIQFNKDIFEQADFINIAVSNVRKALLEGALFVIVVLFIFLMSFRTTIISVVAIPLSLLVTVLTLKLFGFTINTMSLGGMTIAIGSLVDDAIIYVENIYKRLKENVRKEKSKRGPSLQVVLNASREIRSSILNATFIIIIAFVPLFFLGGMEGRMLKPLGIAYIVSLFASLIVAMTVTPVLCSYMLTNEKRLIKRKVGSWVTRSLTYFYMLSLKQSLKQKWIIVSASTILFILAFIVFLSFGRTFLPPFNEGSLAINIATIPGISLEESNKIGVEAEKILLAIPEVTTTSRKTGRAELAEHSFGVNVAEIEIPFVLKERSRAEFLQDVRDKLGQIQGIIIEVGQPITHRIDHMLSGTRSNIAIKLFGTDLREMYMLAMEIRNSIENVEGIADLNVEQQIEIPQIQIKPKRDMLAKYGIPVSDFIQFVDVAFGGEKISDVFEEERSFDLVLRFDDPYRGSLEAINNVLIDTDSGTKIPLKAIADISSTSGPTSINRENVKRKIVISANIAGRDLRSVVNDIQKHIGDEIVFPEGYSIQYGGQFESEERASRIILFTSLAAIIVIFLILYQEFKKSSLAWIILLNLPLALIGGVASIWITSSVLSIPAIIGFITLFGIATRNGILLVSKYRNLAKEGYSLQDTVIKGSMDRLSPILMTALTAALALIPLAIAGDKPGNEIQSPMAVVILGGLLSSTLLNVYVVPVVYTLMNSKKSNHEK
ncbi:MAG: efflux RND transporter permease subunit [Bacteroidales bacterium]|nr:efflux RND transporter permease subunit [Bacteroidota bacterium]MBL6949629.1 efflux RND transporter permease subunit [Bacteroidales bacterium]